MTSGAPPPPASAEPPRGLLSSRFRIRPARLDDEPLILALVPRFVEHGAADGHTPEEVIDGTRRVLAEALRLNPPSDAILIAEEEGDGQGFVYVVTERDFFTGEPYAHVSEIATDRSGSGAGAALMSAVEAWAAERGYRFVTLNVVEENRAAQRFYDRLGYGPGHRHLVKRLIS
ncbi:MAG TPA: GNAT family N-acetyltransferase [Candidatus Baltobacteraceae bacterium]|nr:GNAT family N-acetyltransferase [Candidatus Baltobacteraceae bacterium]